MVARLESLRLEAKTPLDLAHKVEQGISARRIRAFLKRTGFTQEELFQAADIPVSTGRRRMAEGRFSRQESDRIARVARIYDVVFDVFGSHPASHEWMTGEIPSLNFKRPIDLLHSEMGASVVETTIMRAAHGVY